MPPPEARGQFLKKQYNTDNFTKSPPHLKFCTLKLNAKASIEYACFSYEICCIQGCCTGYSLRTVQWQYWSPIIFCAIFIYFLSQYCMGSDKKRNRPVEVLPQQNRGRYFFTQNVTPVPVSDEVGNVNVDQFLEHLIQEYRTRYPGTDCPVVGGSRLSLHPPKPIGPPCYIDALHMPKPPKNIFYSDSCSGNVERFVVNQDVDALPSYENAVTQ